ncbi:MAG TPA: hypothetical protein VFV10_17495 [Gammaproteobacteria bacterium]|nr:hypothetical protein [Gammaproteobacteria bacterium]
MPALKHIRLAELFRYGTVTVAGYALLYGGTYALTEWAHVSPRIAYMSVVTLIYVALYVSYSSFVFRERFTPASARRFVVALVFVWLLNNAFFYVLTKIVGLNYLVVITLNLLLFGGVRFFVQRFYVFAAPAGRAMAKDEQLIRSE